MNRVVRKIGWIGVTILAAIAGVLGWYLFHPAAVLPPADALVKASRAPLILTVHETGRIRPFSEVDLRSKVAGQVRKIKVEVGDKVRAGQVLLELDAAESRQAYAQAEADLAIAQADLTALLAGLRREELAEAEARVQEAKSQRDGAQDAWHRAREANKAEGLTASELNETRAEKDRTEAIYQGAQRRLAALKTRVLPDERKVRAQVRKAELNLRAAREQIERAILRSPVDGTVIHRGVEVGEMVTPGVAETAARLPLLTVANLSRLLVEAEVNQIDVARLNVGLTATIRVDALPGEAFSGRIRRIAPAAIAGRERDVQLFPVSVLLDGNANGRLRPGMSADLDIEVLRRESVLQLPVQAVRRGNDLRGSVTLVSQTGQGQQRTEERSVSLGVHTDQMVEIVSGLAEGDTVLIAPPPADGNVNRF